MKDVDINPAGTRLAWIEDDGKTARIIIHDIATSKALRTMRTEPETKLWAVKWADDETLLVDESVTHTLTLNLNQPITEELQRWIAVDASGGTDRLLLMRDGYRDLVSGLRIVRAHTTKPGKIYMSTWD